MRITESRVTPGRMLPVSGAVISPVGQITYKGGDHIVAGGKMGDISQRLYNEIVAIQYGEKEDPFGWREKIA